MYTHRSLSLSPQLLLAAGNGLLSSGGGVSAAIEELTNGTFAVRVEVHSPPFGSLFLCELSFGGNINASA
jgi:hypothetical protein